MAAAEEEKSACSNNNGQETNDNQKDFKGIRKEELDENDGADDIERLSKSEKKQKRFERIIDNKKRNRKDERARKKLKKSHEGNDSGANSTDNEEHVSKRDQQKLVKDRQLFGKEHGQKICIDLNLEKHMSKKECSRLAQQIGRLYGSNKKAEIPAHILLAGVDKEGYLYGECKRKNSGFENYIIDVHEDQVSELFDKKEVVYLSPDSPNILESVEHEKVYVIGGLVDETVSKLITLTKAGDESITTARLPIDVYMDVDQRAKGNHNKILTINQVFDILLTYVQTQNWRTALPVGVPRRKGYVLRSDI